MNKYFVWVAGFRGPEAQIWNDDVTTGDGKAKPCIFKIKIADDEADMSLDELAEAYKGKKNG